MVNFTDVQNMSDEDLDKLLSESSTPEQSQAPTYNITDFRQVQSMSEEELDREIEDFSLTEPNALTATMEFSQALSKGAMFGFTEIGLGIGETIFGENAPVLGGGTPRTVTKAQESELSRFVRTSPTPGSAATGAAIGRIAGESAAVAGALGPFAAKAAVPVGATILGKGVNLAAKAFGLGAGTELVKPGNLEEKLPGALGTGVAASIFGPVGAGAVTLAKKGGKAVLDIVNPKVAKIAKEYLGLLPEETIKKGLKRQQAARKAGTTLTPAEAFDDPAINRAQSYIEENPKVKGFKARRVTDIDETISAYMDGLAPPPTHSTRAAQQQLQDRISATMKQQAEPYYKLAGQTELDLDDAARFLQDPDIIAEMDALNKIINETSSKSTQAIRDLPPNSVLRWDKIRKSMRGRAAALRGSDKPGDSIKSLDLESKAEELNQLLLKKSPALQKARGFYSESFDYSENAGNLFSPDNVTLIPKIRDAAIKDNPVAWRQFVKGQILKRVGDTEGDDLSKVLTSKVFKNPTFRKSISTALDNPATKNAQLKFDYLADSIKYVKGQTTEKIKEGIVDTPVFRSAGQSLTKGVMGAYDKATAEFITNPKWDDIFIKVMESNMSETAKLNQILSIVGNIAVIRASGEAGGAAVQAAGGQ